MKLQPSGVSAVGWSRGSLSPAVSCVCDLAPVPGKGREKCGSQIWPFGQGAVLLSQATGVLFHKERT